MSVGEIISDLLSRPTSENLHTVSLKHRLVSGAFWSLGGAVATRILRIPISVVLARLMGPVEYGELGIVIGSIDLFSVFAGIGLGLTATKYVAELRNRDPLRAGRIIAVSTVLSTVTSGALALLLYIFAPWLASGPLAHATLTKPLRIGAFSLFFSGVSGAQLGALAGFEAFRQTAQIQALIGMLDVPMMLGGYYIAGLPGVVWGMAASKCVDWLLKGVAVRAQARRHHIHVVLNHWKHELKVLWTFSIPAALAGIMVIPVNWICSAILVNQRDGYAAMGAYSAANQWYGALLSIPAVLGSALLPLLSERLGDDDKESSTRLLVLMMKVNGAVLIPCGLVICVFSPFIMRVYGGGYKGAWPTLIAVSATAVVMGVITPVGDIITASSKMWTGFAMNAGWALIFILATISLVHWGAVGLASARLIAYIIHAGWTLGFAYWVVRSQTSTEKRQCASSLS
jgi:O-antigen/teichoic acid export membrane protein